MLANITLLLFFLISFGVKAHGTRCAQIFSSSKELSIDLGQAIQKDAYSKLKKAGWQPHDGFERRAAHWAFDGPQDSLTRYARAFGKILQNSFVEDSPAVALRRLIAPDARVLDLFGSGFFALDRTSPQNVFGMRFEPSDVDLEKNERPKEILGDAFNNKTWSKLDRVLTKKDERRKFDLITMNPVGGWEIYNKNDTLNMESALAEQLLREIIIGHVLQRLSPKGVFIFRTGLSIGFSEDPAVLQRLYDLQTKISQTTSYRFEFLLPTTGQTPYEIQGIIFPKKLNRSPHD